VANSYYELQALTTNSNCKTKYSFKKSALEIVKLQKEAARGTELAVQKFKAEVLKSQSMEYDINKISRRQRIELIFIRSFSSGNNKRQNCGFKYCSCVYLCRDSVAITNKSSRY
jgi:hypothetical protein